MQFLYHGEQLQRDMTTRQIRCTWDAEATDGSRPISPPRDGQECRVAALTTKSRWTSKPGILVLEVTETGIPAPAGDTVSNVTKPATPKLASLVCGSDFS